MNTRRAGNGRYRRSLRSAASSSRSRSIPYSSTSAKRDAVDASGAAVAAHTLPRPSNTSLRQTLSNSAWNRLVGSALAARYSACCKARTPVASDSRKGGPSRYGTHQTHPLPTRANEAAALPSPQVVLSCGSTGTTTASDSLPARRPLPGSTPVIGRRGRRLSAVRFGRGGPPQFPPPPSERSAPSYAGESLAAALPGSSPLPWPSP